MGLDKRDGRDAFVRPVRTPVIPQGHGTPQRTRTVPSVIVVLGPSGTLHRLDDETATWLAQGLRQPTDYDIETARGAARTVELRLVGEDDTPIEFDEDERGYVAKALDLILGELGELDPDICALFFDLQGLPEPR